MTVNLNVGNYCSKTLKSMWVIQTYCHVRFVENAGDDGFLSPLLPCKPVMDNSRETLMVDGLMKIDGQMKCLSMSLN